MSTRSVDVDVEKRLFINFINYVFYFLEKKIRNLSGYSSCKLKVKSANKINKI